MITKEEAAAVINAAWSKATNVVVDSVREDSEGTYHAWASWNTDMGPLTTNVQIENRNGTLRVR